MNTYRWTEDELILVLEAYLLGVERPEDSGFVELAKLVHPHPAESVRRQIQNFVALDRTRKGGLPNASRTAKAVWVKYAKNPSRLRSKANTLRKRVRDMPYIRPEDVTAPQSRWRLQRVIHSGGESEWSVAEGYWDNEPCVAIRWNGKDDKRLGFPISGSTAVWFIVPEEMEDDVRKAAERAAKRLRVRVRSRE